MYAFPNEYNFHILQQVSSTNLHAMQLAHEGMAANGDVFFAKEQLQGRGQRGKSWQAKADESILVSIVLDTTKLPPSHSFRLIVTVALSVKKFMENILTEPVLIKWPNDVYIGDRKAGGILIESILQGNIWKWGVVGIGINMNQADFAADLPHAVSIKMHTGQHYNCDEYAKQLCGFVNHYHQQLINGQWPMLLATYNASLYGKDTVVKLKWGNITTPFLIRKVNEYGALIAGENDEWSFEHGDVEWVL